jgi:anti-sigma B factor antagonist
MRQSDDGPGENQFVLSRGRWSTHSFFSIRRSPLPANISLVAPRLATDQPEIDQNGYIRLHLSESAVVSLQFETAKVEPDITVVRLIGSVITRTEGHALELLVRTLVGRGEKKLIFDLSRVEKIDVIGIQFLIQCLFTMRRADGGLRLASATPKVARVFTVTLLDTLLPCYRTWPLPPLISS